ncbi:MAG TPA: hypothetical protein VIL86_03725 [Tepidisphaeraceae bacterium]|jgi:hypothetical protein
MKTDKNVSAFARSLLAAVWAMDARAPLCNYAAYSGKTQLEPAWAHGLKSQLDSAYDVIANRKQPVGLIPDLFVRFKDMSRLWVEIKRAWKHYFSAAELPSHVDTGLFSGYLNGRASGGSVVGDFEKLEKLTFENAEYAALLLIGFDEAEGTLQDDVARMRTTQELAARGWMSQPPSFQLDRRCPDFRIGCWFWWKHIRSSSSSHSPEERR